MDGAGETTAPIVELWRGHRATLGPAWRFALAQRKPLPAPAVEDPDVIQLRDYLRAVKRAGQTAAAEVFPRLSAAAGIEQDSRRRDELALLVVSGMPPEAIAERVGLPLASIEAWERLYFDVRGTGVPFAEFHVVRPAQEAGRREFAGKLHVAMAGGPAGALAALDLDKPPLTEAERLVKRELALEIKLDAAVSFPISSERSGLEFVKLFVRWKTEQGRLSLQKARFAAKCQQAQERAVERQARAEADKVKAARAAAREHAAQEGRRQEEATRVTARNAERELLYQTRRAEMIARTARGAASPLSQIRRKTMVVPPTLGDLRWGAEAAAPSRREPRRKTARRRSSATRRLRTGSRGRKIQAAMGRDHRRATGENSVQCLAPGESLTAPAGAY